MLEELARREQVPGEINKEIADRKLLPESAALTVGGIAALLVGACCFAPAVLMSIGLGGAWLSNLPLLEPYRPIFIAVALIALAFAWRRIYRPAVACAPDAVCAVPRVRRGYKVALWMVAALLVVTFAFPYFCTGVVPVVKEPVLESVLTCPSCGFARRELMPTDACQYYYECSNCRTLLRPKPGDCCVFCSFGSVKCPPIQVQGSCCL